MIVELVQLVANYWYIPVIAFLALALRISRLQVAANAGKVATANAEIRQQNANFASLQDKADEQSKQVEALNVELQQRSKMLADASEKLRAARSRDHGTAVAMVRGADRNKSCTQAMEDAVSYYRTHNHQ